MKTMRTLKKAVCAAILAGVVSFIFAQEAPSNRIRVNSVGFLPDMPKRASVQFSGSAITAGDMFSVVRVSDGQAASTGTLGNNVRNTDTGDTIRVADFSSVTEPGRYYLEVPGVGRSPEFSIADDALNEPFRAMMLGMYLWRCGNPGGVDATYNDIRYNHGRCHHAPARLCHTPTTGGPLCVGAGSGNDTRDGSGGWHDAGDYNKYVVNSGVTVGLMLKAWEHFGETINKVELIAANNTANQYESGMPKYLAEVKWNLDWVAKMQYGPNDGRVSSKLSTRDFCGMIMPEEETATQYFVPWSTSATAAFVAMLAQGSRIYREYDEELADKWLAQARVSYETLEEYPNNLPPNQSWFNTGGYTDNSTNPSYRLWAAAEMWETTGESKFLEYFEANVRTSGTGAIGTHLGWADVGIMAAMTYLTSERPGKHTTTVNSVRNTVISAANTIVTNTNTHGYARPFGSSAGSYYWGNHGALTANTYILHTAYQLTDEERYRNAGHEIVGHILGRNFFARSFITGVGHNPPQFPHDRRSSASEKAWPGYLVGGPNNQMLRENNGNPVAPPGATCANAAVCYFDYEPDYARNEIAINWNASMIYALAGFVTPSTPVSVSNRAPVARSSAPQAKATRMIQVKNGRSSVTIPQGAKIYSLNGRLVTQRKHGDPTPVLRRNGVFIMKVDVK